MKKSEIKEKLSGLPQAVQDAVLSEEFDETLRALAAKYKIHYDKWELLEEEIIMVLLSLKDPQELKNSLSYKVGLNKEDAEHLFQDLVEKLFKPIRRLLQEIIEESEQEKASNNEKTAGKKIIKSSSGLDSAFNLGEIEQIDDPYLEKIEL